MKEVFAAAMTDAERFAQRFEQAVGFPPLPYQVRMALAPEWPGLVRVPTGLGKTAAVVLTWLWRRRYADPKVRQSCPRRLVYCLPLRTLVQQVVDNVALWLSRLNVPVFGHVAAVGSQFSERGSDSEFSEPVGVYVMMGGAVERDWVRLPEYDQILIGTQDQLLSRALNRGYGVSRGRWPMDFAFLNNDVWWVYDEVQLMGGGGIYTTAQLEAFRRRFGTCGSNYSTWMSATLDPEWLDTIDFVPYRNATWWIDLDEDDLTHPIIQQRYRARKLLYWSDFYLSSSDASRPNEYAKRVAELALGKHREGALTLVILNRVNRAQAVYRQLLAMSPNVPIRLVHSRFRPADRQDIGRAVIEMESSGGIVVATQAVEAGVDLSARTLISEIAPWASLVQRFGRCNRRGEFQEADVWLLDMEDDLDCAQPYAEEEIKEARARLRELEEVGQESLKTWRMPPPEGQVLRQRDVLDLFDTTPDLAGLDLDISPYVRDISDTDVQVYWRSIGEGPQLSDWPARPEEICNVSMSAMRDYLTAKKENRTRKDRVWTWDWLTGTWMSFRERNPVPGKVYLLDAALGGYRKDVGFDPGAWEPVSIVPSGDEETRREELSDADDPNTYQGSFVLLADHLKHVGEAAQSLMEKFQEQIPEDLRRAVVEAANWHDIGKAHPVFQERLLAGLSNDHPYRASLWAKSGRGPEYHEPQAQSSQEDSQERLAGIGGEEGPLTLLKVPDRKHFRHELASALAYLQLHDPEQPDVTRDLVTYLIAAHHGKVRMSIRSLPDEIPPAADPRERWLFARGVWDGDSLPAVILPTGEVLPQVTLQLGWMTLGRGPWGESWVDRTMHLLKQYGPFRLGFLEALVRVADWRGSEREGKRV